MAITFVGGKSMTHSLATAQTVSLTDLVDPNLQTAVLAIGDYVIINVVHAMPTTNNRTLAQLTPTGYTSTTAAVVAAAAETNVVAMGLFYKKLTAVDTSVTIPACGVAGTNSMSVTIQVFRGVDPTTPLGGVAATTATAINSAVADPPSITTPAAAITNGALVYGAVGGAGIATTTANYLIGSTGYDTTNNAYMTRTNTTSTSSRALAASGYKSGLAVNTAYNAGTVSFVSTTVAMSWAAISIILSPQPVLNVLGFNETNNQGTVGDYGYVSEKAVVGSPAGRLGTAQEGAKTPGSTISIGTVNTGGNRFSVNASTGVVTVAAGATFNYITQASVTVDFIETLAGAVGSPKTNTKTILVKPILQGVAKTVVLDVNDRTSVFAPPTSTITATSVVGEGSTNATQSIRASHGFLGTDTTPIYLEMVFNTYGGGNQPGTGFAEMGFRVHNYAPPGQLAADGINITANGTGTADGGPINAGAAFVPALTVGQTRMLARSGKKIWTGINGVWANSGDPVLGTNPSYTFVTELDEYFFYISMQLADKWTVNFGASAFSYAIPAGFKSYDLSQTGIAAAIVARAQRFFRWL